MSLLPPDLIMTNIKFNSKLVVIIGLVIVSGSLLLGVRIYFIPKIKQLPHTNVEYHTVPTSPRDPSVEIAIKQEFQVPEDDPSPLKYYYNKVDLNGDNQPEIVGYINHHFWCGSAGCSVFILEKKGKDYQFIGGSTSPIDGRLIIVTELKSFGWKNLILGFTDYKIDDFELRGEYKILKFDGSSYTTEVKLNPKVKIKGIGFASDWEYAQ